MLPLLEQSFDVLAVDLPGFGRSGALPPSIDPTPLALADAVEDEMGRAGFDRAHFAGNSLGGCVALELARRGRAETVTAISPAGLQHAREKAWGAAVLRGLRWVSRNAPEPEPVVRNPVARTLLLSSVYGRGWKKDPQHAMEEAQLLGDCPGFDATLPFTFSEQPRGLTTLDTPVLLLWGTLDVVLLPRQGRRFERLIPGAELRYLRGLGHTPMSDAPEELAEAITAFALERGRPGAERVAVSGV